MMKRLISWKGLTHNVTLGKVYELSKTRNTVFFDDKGDNRLMIYGEWEEVCTTCEGVQPSTTWLDMEDYGDDTTVIAKHNTPCEQAVPGKLIGKHADVVICDEVEENSGANGNYYRCTVLSRTTLDDRGSYEAEANDIIETLEMNFAEANAFKALWRKASARQGNGKADHNPLYDAQKVYWSGKRLVAQES